MSPSAATSFIQSPKALSSISSTHSDPDALDLYSTPTTPRSRWGTIRKAIREPVAEFAGVAIFVMFGTAADCQVVLSTNKGVASSPKGDFLSVSFGWAIGLAMGAWVSGGISGGHLNPAVTLALASWRRFPWRKVPAYIFAQILGGVAGAAVVYGNYAQAIEIFEGGHGIRTKATGGLFATFALDYMSNISCFFVEFIGTAVLSFMVLAATDKKNNAPPSGLLPVALLLTLLGLAVGFGMQTSFAFNPARDFGPRLLLTFAGYGKQLYDYRSQYWLWCPIIAPIVGAQFSTIFYDLFLNENGRFGDDEIEHDIPSPKADGSVV